MMLTALMLLLAPPIPAPPPDRIAAAKALWEKVPPSDGERDQAINTALHALAWAILSQSQVYPTTSQKRGMAWLAKHERLVALYRTRLPPVRSRIEGEVLACASTGLARGFSVDELRQIGTFVGTDVGAKFWTLAGSRPAILSGCYETSLRDTVVYADEDLRAMGMKPPKPRPPGSIVS